MPSISAETEPLTDVATAPAATPKGRPAVSAVKNVTSIWAGLVVNIGLSFFLAPFIVRSLGNVYYGIWALLSQFTGYLWLFDFGVRESVIKHVAQYHAADQKEALAETVHAAVSLYSVISLLAMVAVGGMTWALPHVFNIPPEAIGTARITLFIVGATIAQGFVFNVYVGVLMGIQRFYLVDRMGIVFSVLRSALVVVLLSAGYGLVTFAIVHFVLNTVSNLLVYGFCRAHLPYLAFRFARPRGAEVRRIVDYGKYVLLNNIGEKLVYASDKLVVGMFLPISMLTYYAIAGNLIGYLKAFISAMASVLNPMASALDSKNDLESLKVLFLRASKAAVIAGLPVCIGFIILGERFVTLWMGPEFGARSAPVLAVLGVAHLVGLPYFTITGALYGIAKHRVTAYARFFEAVANVSLSVILVQWYGLIGVAIGTLIPQVIIAAGILPAALPKLLPISLREYYVSTYVRPFLSSVPFWFACVAVDRLVPTNLLTFFAYGAVALPAYVVPCWFVALSPDDRQMITKRLTRRPARWAARATQ